MPFAGAGSVTAGDRHLPANVMTNQELEQIEYRARHGVPSSRTHTDNGRLRPQPLTGKIKR